MYRSLAHGLHMVQGGSQVFKYLLNGEHMKSSAFSIKPVLPATSHTPKARNGSPPQNNAASPFACTSLAPFCHAVKHVLSVEAWCCPSAWPNSSIIIWMPLLTSLLFTWPNPVAFYSHLIKTSQFNTKCFLIYTTEPESPSWPKLRECLHSYIGTPPCQAHRRGLTAYSIAYHLISVLS